MELFRKSLKVFKTLHFADFTIFLCWDFSQTNIKIITLNSFNLLSTIPPSDHPPLFHKLTSPSQFLSLLNQSWFKLHLTSHNTLSIHLHLKSPGGGSNLSVSKTLEPKQINELTQAFLEVKSQLSLPEPNNPTNFVKQLLSLKALPAEKMVLSHSHLYHKSRLQNGSEKIKSSLVSNIEKSYNALSKKAFNDNQVLIIGKQGVGKSTLINYLCDIDLYSVIVDGLLKLGNKSEESEAIEIHHAGDNEDFSPNIGYCGAKGISFVECPGLREKYPNDWKISNVFFLKPIIHKSKFLKLIYTVSYEDFYTLNNLCNSVQEITNYLCSLLKNEQLRIHYFN